MNMSEQQKDLINRLEPEAANKPIDILATGGMQELATVSTAISLKRIADILESVYYPDGPHWRAALGVREID